ncbi:MAG TPA: hypothetical protein VHA76_06790 [Solirubrobacterales bacterium]|nr:hypothetical protein [Solirubrobacterales bacterium]
MDPRTAGGLPTLLESTLLTMRPANHERMRHDLRTLAARLPDEAEDPLGRLMALGERVGAAFTTTPLDAAAAEAELDPERVLTLRHGDPLLVAALVAAVGQRRGWSVAVIGSTRRALVGHTLCGPPFVISVTDGGRVVDAHDYAGEGDLFWRCPHEIAYALEARRRAADQR